MVNVYNAVDNDDVNNDSFIDASFNVIVVITCRWFERCEWSCNNDNDDDEDDDEDDEDDEDERGIGVRLINYNR